MPIEFELVEPVSDAQESALPLTLRSPLESLFIAHEQAVHAIHGIAGFLGKKDNAALNYFFKAAQVHDRWAATIQLDRLFDASSAVKALDADYWQRAILLTDVLDIMPAEKRNEWNESIRQHTTPSFERGMVLDTLQNLVLQRERFFSERVDGVFRSLSGTHVTNAPEGFSKRMILDYFISSYGSLNWDKIAFIHDLRFVIAAFMGREQPSRQVTHDSITRIHRGGAFGEWHDFDGGAFRFKLYKKGTVHVEVHPDMAWRLNAILAKLHPHAIPSRFRKTPPKVKTFNLSSDLISDKAIVQLNGLRSDQTGRKLTFPYAGEAERQSGAKAREEAESVLARIGGVKLPDGAWAFDYSAPEVIHEVIRLGTLPDISYQYFATGENLARHAVDLADISDEDDILEPSAGQGGIADYLPKANLTCVEISRLHCAVLQAKGYSVVEGDFLTLPAKRYSKIVMNPPFSGNRATLHVAHAAGQWLKPGGRIVAILPASLKGKELVAGMRHSYTEVFKDQFTGTGVSVVILTLDSQP